MNCFICHTKMEDYFTKRYGERTHYFIKCPECGLVVNQTVYGMKGEEWEIENNYHKKSQGKVDSNNPIWSNRIERLKPQAELIAKLYEKGIFSPDSKAVDYGGGDGLFSEMVDQALYVSDNFRPTVGIYEKYLRIPGKVGYYDDSEMTPRSFDVVISSAVLEHMIGMEDIDTYFKLVNESGTVVIHTLICEEVPKDPDWFYIRKPVHCTLWTNEAMRRIYSLYSFKGCAYHLPSKIWLFFKDKEMYKNLIRKHEEIPGEWTFSDEFVDYWKQKPYHVGEYIDGEEK